MLWSAFWIQSWPQAALSIFLFRSLTPSHEGVPLRSGVWAWDADLGHQEEVEKGLARPEQPPPYPSGSLGPRLELQLGKLSIFLYSSVKQPLKIGRLRPGDTANCYLRAVAARLS